MDICRRGYLASRAWSLAVLAAALLIGSVQAIAQQRVVAEKYAVTSGHPEATAAGLEVLRRGGNVVDAAVATSLALGVAEPYASGLGGKLVLLYREAESGCVYGIEALCPSADSVDPEEFVELGRDQRKYGWRAVCVPGLPAGLYAAHRRWGSLPWQDLVEPAAALAERGVEVNAKMRSMFAPKAKRLDRDDEAARLYLVDGMTPQVGAVLKNPDLAHTLRELGQGGASAFYHGEAARRLVVAARRHGSDLTLDDLRRYAPRFTKPLSVRYRGYCISSSPPPLTGGATVLLTCKALESHQWAGTKPRGVQYIDGVNRALLGIYPRVRDTVADVPDVNAATRALLRAEQVAAIRAEAATVEPASPYDRAERGAPAAATGDSPPADKPSAGEDDASTSHICVADAAGNIVCLTQSLSHHFGASVVAPGTGFLLNNSMANFATRWKESINYVAGGKRPRSTIAPIIVSRGSRPVLALGIPGGQRIPTTTIQLLIDVLDFQTPLADAFDRPRFHLRRPLSTEADANVVDLEAGTIDALATELAELGWQTKSRARTGHYFGGGSAIQFAPGEKLIAVADERRTNYADGD